MPNSFKISPDMYEPGYPKKFLILYVEETPHPASWELKVNIEIKIKKEASKKNMPHKNFIFFFRYFFYRYFTLIIHDIFVLNNQLFSP